MNTIRTIIVDDEKNSRANTKLMLTKYFSEIEIIGEAENGIEGRKLIAQLHPDLVFLDVNMPEMTGLEMLESIPDSERNFYVIFLTAYDEYTIQAIRAGAVDYLMKPLMKEELMQAIKRVSKYIEEKKHSENASNNTNKLMVSHSKGFTLIEFNEIIFLEAAGNYTDFYLTGNRKIISSRTLKDYDDILDKNVFFRISRSAIVNLHHVKEYNNTDENLTLTENHKIHISRSKWAEFSDVIKSKTINPLRNS